MPVGPLDDRRFRVQRFGAQGEGDATNGIPGFQTSGDLRIKVPFGASAPGNETTVVNFQGNLSAAATTGTVVPTSIQVYDSQTGGHLKTHEFRLAKKNFGVQDRPRGCGDDLLDDLRSA